MMHDTKKIIIVLVCAFCLGSQAYCQNIVIRFSPVITSNNMAIFGKQREDIGKPVGPSPWDLDSFGVKEITYTKFNLNADFAQNVRKAKMLVLERDIGGSADAVFSKPSYRAALSDFLAAGGILFFQYNAPFEGAKEYFASIGVKVPPAVAIGTDYNGYNVRPTQQFTNHPVFMFPNKISNLKSLKAYGGWTDWDSCQKAMLMAEDNPSVAAMLFQEKVLGKGTVVFSRISTLINNARYNSRDFIENILALAFGKLSSGTAVESINNDKQCKERNDLAPEEMLEAQKGRSANPLYLRKLTDKPWWNKDWNYRIPFVIFESCGISRKVLVSFTYEFPAETKLSSIRVVTPYGEEIPFQAKLENAGKNRINVLFAVDVLPFEHLPGFVYFDYNDKPPVKYADSVELREEAGYFILSNASIFCKIRKDMPMLEHLQPQGNPTGNQLYSQLGLGVRGGFRLQNVVFSAGVVGENGPLLKTIEYQGDFQGMAIRVVFGLTGGGKSLYYAVNINGEKPVFLQRETDWLPGKGLQPPVYDNLYFPGKDGVRLLQIKDVGELSKNLIPEMSEGWYAFEDTETGQTVGEIFELCDTTRVNFYSAHGYMAYIMQKYSSSSVKGALVPLPAGSGFNGIMSEYLAFKNPPTLHCSTTQRRIEVPENWQKPVFGKNLIRAYHRQYNLEYCPALKNSSSPCRVIPDFVQSMKKIGANWITMWPSPILPFWDFADNLAAEAHKAGMGVDTRLPILVPDGNGKLRDAYWDDMIKSKEYIMSSASEFGKHAMDSCSLRDEACYVIKSDEARYLFKKRYGMAPAGKMDLEKLNLPAYHNRVFFQMDTYTESIRAMAEAIRAKNKNVVISDQVNLSSLTSLAYGAPHDFERHSDFLDTLSMDLYGGPADVYKYCIKFMRAAFNNEKPVWLYWGCDPRKETVRPAQDYLLMWGLNGLLYFPPGGIYPAAADEAKKSYYFLDYTGLGDMLAQYKPVKKTAIFWDREGLLDAIRRGLWAFEGSLYDRRVKNLAMLRNVQSDIVYSKYFSAQNLGAYTLLIIPNDPVLSDQRVEVMESFLKAGGNALVEGEALKNKAMQKLLKVVPNGELEKMQGVIKTGNASVPFIGQRLPVKNIGAEKEMSFENGEPAFLSVRVGKGQIFYTPLLLSDTLAYQGEVAELMRSLVERLSGEPLAQFDSDVAKHVDSSLLSDGTNYILGVYNSAFSEMHASIKFNLPKNPRVIIDFSTGETRDFRSPFDCVLDHQAVRYLYIGERQAVPEAFECPLDKSYFYSSYPGKEILSFTNLTAREENTNIRSKRAKKTGGISYIGVLSDKQGKSDGTPAVIKGDVGIYQNLQNRKDLLVEYIYNLKPETLSFYDAVIIPNIGYSRLPSVMQSGWENVVRDYVVNGGSILLCHHAVGVNPPCDKPPFPEIGEPVGAVDIKNLIVAGNHPVTTAESVKKRFPNLTKDPAFEAQMGLTELKAGEIITGSFPDYIPIKAGVRGQIFIRGNMERGMGGEPVVVAGSVGKGKVVLCGLGLGSNGKDEILTKGEENLLVNAMYWLTEK